MVVSMITGTPVITLADLEKLGVLTTGTPGKSPDILYFYMAALLREHLGVTPHPLGAGFRV